MRSFKFTEIAVLCQNLLEIQSNFANYSSACTGLFSFKNFQLMRITNSLYRPSGFARAFPYVSTKTLI